MPTRARQFAADQHQKVEPAHHRGGKRNVLGVIEHRAVPGTAHRKRRRGKEARAGPSNGSRHRPDGGNAAEAGQRRQQVPDLVGIERNELLEADRNEIEEAAVQIKIAKMKQRLFDEAAA
jgi:hypothetical protein